jgi:hypothetical protein
MSKLIYNLADQVRQGTADLIMYVMLVVLLIATSAP